MSRRNSHYYYTRPRNPLAETVGRIVLMPFKLTLVIAAVPVVAIVYPFIGGYVFIVNSDLAFRERIRFALTWPTGLFAMNDLLSLGGLDNPALTRVGNWIVGRR